MATVKETVKHALFTYPTIFPSPFQVMEHLFCCIGNGFDWKDGELVSYDSIPKTYTMKYDNKAYDSIKKFLTPDSPFHTEYDLKNKADTMVRKFIEDNIEDVLNASLNTDYFNRGKKTGYYFTKDISVNYARALNFPDDIKLDWGQALYEFLEHWLFSLNVVYGAASRGLDSVSFWPEHIQKGRAAILAARERLHPLINKGVTYQEMIERNRKLMEKLKNER